MHTLLYECQDGNSKQAIRNGNHPTQKKMSGASGGSAAQTVSRGEELREKYGTEGRAQKINLGVTGNLRGNLTRSEVARESRNRKGMERWDEGKVLKALDRRARKTGKDVVVTGKRNEEGWLEGGRKDRTVPVTMRGVASSKGGDLAEDMRRAQAILAQPKSSKRSKKSSQEKELDKLFAGL